MSMLVLHCGGCDWQITRRAAQDTPSTLSCVA
jgi:hypothetical protein